MQKVDKNKVFNVLIILVLALGIFLRLKYFLNFRWLWNDEILLFQNIDSINIFKAFYQLNGEQAAPPLFLFFSSIIANICRLFHPNYTLGSRIIPFTASIVSVFGFYQLSKKYLTNKVNILAANILFCINLHLIYFAQDFKQYSSDTCLTILILLSYFYIDFEKLTLKKTILFGVGYMLCCWFSFTSIFILPGVIAAILCKHINKENIKKIFFLVFPIITGILGLYISQRYLQGSSYLANFWENGYIQYFDWGQILRVLNNTLLYYFGISGFNLFYIYNAIFIIGLIKIFTSIKIEKYQILLLSIVTVLFISTAHIYPFYIRTTLYMLPIFILIMMLTFEKINNDSKILSLSASIISLILIIYSIQIIYPFKIITGLYIAGIAFLIIIQTVEIFKESIYIRQINNIIVLIFLFLAVANIFKYQNIFTYETGNLKVPVNYYYKHKDIDLVIANNYDAYSYDYYKKIYNFKQQYIIFYTLQDLNNILSNLPKNRTYAVLNSVAGNHPDLVNNKLRHRFGEKLIKSISKHGKILYMYNDGRANIMIKFTK